MKRRIKLFITLVLALVFTCAAFSCKKNYEAGGQELSCTLYIDCRTILDNRDMLDPNKAELVPEDGIILDTVTCAFSEGDTVFDVLQRELRARGIHLESSFTPVYNSAYIEGINNIYEFDCGELSGWEYSVNGVFPNYGCSQYKLSDGDEIRWLFTCDLGKDVENAAH